MAQANKLGPADSIGTGWAISAETRMIRGVRQLMMNYQSGIGSAEKGNKWWAWKDSNLRPADYESDALTN
jgi:hypothetical protein